MTTSSARSTRPAASPEVLSSAVVPTPIGPLTVVASPRGVRAVLWPEEREGRVVLPASSSPDAAADAVLATAVRQLDEYFAGTRREFDVPLDPTGTAFQQSAWSVLRTIPYGRTMSYGEQATALGDARKARAVGAANGRNPISVIVPCHRVVGSNGSLTGFAGGLSSKEWLLAHERQHA